LAYLVVDHGSLVLRTHEGFTWTPKADYELETNIYDKWIDVAIMVKFSTTSDGILAVFVNGREIAREQRPTLPSENADAALRLGIYNAFVSETKEPRGTQVIYYDEVRRSEL